MVARHCMYILSSTYDRGSCHWQPHSVSFGVAHPRLDFSPAQRRQASVGGRPTIPRRDVGIAGRGRLPFKFEAFHYASVLQYTLASSHPPTLVDFPVHRQPSFVGSCQVGTSESPSPHTHPYNPLSLLSMPVPKERSCLLQGSDLVPWILQHGPERR